jgi:hypothetical protein
MLRPHVPAARSGLRTAFLLAAAGLGISLLGWRVPISAASAGKTWSQPAANSPDIGEKCSLGISFSYS